MDGHISLQGASVSCVKGQVGPGAEQAAAGARVAAHLIQEALHYDNQGEGHTACRLKKASLLSTGGSRRWGI